MNKDREIESAQPGEGVVESTSNTPGIPTRWHYAVMMKGALARKVRAQARASAQTGGGKNDLHAAHARSLNNRSVIEVGGTCGCFYCLTTFDASDVAEWVDATKTTALCPSCHIDSVLSSRTDRIDVGFLRRMRDQWF